MCLAVPGRIIDVTSDSGCTRHGRVDFAGVVREVNLTCVPEGTVGDFVLVHAGVAIGMVHESEARRTLELLTDILKSDKSQNREIR